MSKRALKQYLNELDKEQLSEQILDLYQRFKPVKVYYDFVFNPKEDKLVEEAKFKIGMEYFPTRSRKKAKMRRSVAQKYIKHFLQLEMDPVLILDLMYYNIEIAQTYSTEKYIKQESFYVSMLRSFEQAVDFTVLHGLEMEFRDRMESIVRLAKENDWFNHYAFEQKTKAIG